MTSVNGAVVWSAKYQSFGEATVNASSTITNNLRYSGHFYDQETGLHYNWNRYYDPILGRYIRKDPIGFKSSDKNLYNYAYNNSVIYIDPWGFKSLTYEEATALVNKYKNEIMVERNIEIYENSTELIVCLMYKESSFDPNAIPTCPEGEKCSARGAFQITEATAKDAGYDHSKISNPSSQANIEYGIKAGVYILYQKTYWNWYGKGDIRSGLMYYHGNKDPSVNKSYADSILNCEKCLKNKEQCINNCLELTHK